jgi:hypothetical protein
LLEANKKGAAMRKCPDCAEENINESLFCKRCGRVLLPPDPIKIDLSNSQSPGAAPQVIPEELQLRIQRSAVTHIEHHKTPEAIDFSDRLLVRKMGATRIMRRRRTGLSVYKKPLMLLTLLVVILISHIIVTLMSKW